MNRAFKYCFLILIFTCTDLCGQFRYSRELTGVSEKWHKVVVPVDVFGHASKDLRDLRILAVDNNADTTEIPFLINKKRETETIDDVALKITNRTNKNGRYYYTLNLSSADVVNELELDFINQNFDFKVDVECSRDQSNWFNLVDDYRILSIRNELTSYEFTTIAFPDADYPFYRISFNSDNDPRLRTARIFRRKVVPGAYYEMDVRVTVTDQESTKTTRVLADLDVPIPVNRVYISTTSDDEYYRPIQIAQLTDSIYTDKGWKYNYRYLGNFIIQSRTPNKFNIPLTTTRRLRLLISNHDNTPLKIKDVEASGPIHELLIRFSDTVGNYYLVYGNSKIGAPNYDLKYYKERIPDDMSELTIEQELDFSQDLITNNSSPLMNKIWLWVTMTMIIVLLSWATIRMMKRA